MGPSLALCFRDSRYFLVDHQKVVLVAVAFLRPSLSLPSPITDFQASDVEIVVLKYEAANVHEFRDLANLRFSFG